MVKLIQSLLSYLLKTNTNRKHRLDPLAAKTTTPQQQENSLAKSTTYITNLVKLDPL